jgi:hypothetical protein
MMVNFFGSGIPDPMNLRISGVNGPRTSQKRSGWNSSSLQP